MITEEEARARADAWINGGVPPEQRREVGSYAFDGGWVVWPKEPPREDPSQPPSTVGGGRGVVDAESGELTFWPSLPAPEIARRYVLSRGEGGAGAQPRAEGSAPAGDSTTSGAASEVASTGTAGEAPSGGGFAAGVSRVPAPRSHDEAAGPADVPRAATHQSSAPAGFRPVNDLESAMERALQNQDQSGYAAALATAELVVPVRPAPDGGVVTATVQREGRSHLLAFTSTATMGATIGRDGAELQFIKASVPQMLATWTDPQVWLAVDPGTPIEGYLPPQWLRDHLAAASTAHPDTPVPSQPPAPAEAPAPAQASAPAQAPAPAPAETAPTVMQKLVPPVFVPYYLDQGYDRVAGFVHRAIDLDDLDAAALLAEVEGGDPGADVEEVHVLRWPAYRPGLYRTPYGGPTEEDSGLVNGWVVEPPPFTGTGFTAGPRGVAEWKVDSVRLPHGAQLWRIGAFPRPVAVFDADTLTWTRAGGGDAAPANPANQGTDGYHARWRGVEYEASPDGEQVRLYRTEPADRFTPVSAGRYVAVVPATDVDELTYLRTVASWRGQPFSVLGASGDWLRVEYLGGNSATAERLGLERFDRGVYQGWAPASEVSPPEQTRI